MAKRRRNGSSPTEVEKAQDAQSSPPVADQPEQPPALAAGTKEPADAQSSFAFDDDLDYEDELSDDEEEEDEDEEEEDEAAAYFRQLDPRLPHLPVSSSDPTLLAFLVALPKDLATALPLADWLAEREDPRADAVRDLAQAPMVIPEGMLNDDPPMIAGRYFRVSRRRGSVAAKAYSGTLLGSLVRTREFHEDVIVRLSYRQHTPERLRAASDRCRFTLLMGLFGTSPRLLQARRILQEEVNLERLQKTLVDCGQAVVPVLAELHASRPERLQTVMSFIWSRPKLHAVGYALMDAIDPTWRQRLTGSRGETSATK